MSSKIKSWWICFHDRHLRKPKLKLATWLHELRPGKTCWADCVIWSMNSRRFNPFSIDSAKSCAKESREIPCRSCYCGGWNNGVCFDLLPKKERDAQAAAAKAARDAAPDELPF